MLVCFLNEHFEKRSFCMVSLSYIVLVHNSVHSQAQLL
jgi:hypothetical protein